MRCCGKFITACKRSLEQGNIFSSMCQEFCSQGWGVCLSACWDTTPPPGPGTPQTRHPTGPGTPQSRHPPDQAPPCAVHAGRYGQQAGGMHPTGMQSCVLYIFAKIQTINTRISTLHTSSIGYIFKHLYVIIFVIQKRTSKIDL